MAQMVPLNMPEAPSTAAAFLVAIAAARDAAIAAGLAVVDTGYSLLLTPNGALAVVDSGAFLTITT